MNTPDKLFLDDSEFSDDKAYMISETKELNTDVEYIRADLMQELLETILKRSKETIIGAFRFEIVDIRDVKNDFKKLGIEPKEIEF